MGKVAETFKTLLSYADLFKINFLFLHSPQNFCDSHHVWGIVSILLLVVCAVCAILFYLIKEPAVINYTFTPVTQKISADFDDGNLLMFTIWYLDEEQNQMYLNFSEIENLFNV